MNPPDVRVCPAVVNSKRGNDPVGVPARVMPPPETIRVPDVEVMAPDKVMPLGAERVLVPKAKVPPSKINGAVLVVPDVAVMVKPPLPVKVSLVVWFKLVARVHVTSPELTQLPSKVIVPA